MTDRYPALHGSFHWDIPATFNFGTDVVDRIAREADKLALIWCNQAGDERRFNFSDIARLTDRLAAGLRARGIGKGDRVIVMLPRIPEWQLAMVAILKLGAVAVPCVTMLTERDLTYRIAHSGAVGVITTDANRAKCGEVAEMRARIAVGNSDSAWEDFDAVTAAAPESFEAARVEAEDAALIFYTSGSTGHPKGVTHASRALYAWYGSAQFWLDLGRDDLMFCTADTGWSKAGTSILFGPWARASAVLFYDGPFVPEERCDLIERHRVTVYCAAATELRHMIALDLSGRDLSSLRLTVSAGEAVNPQVVERWQAMTSGILLEAYGLTETLMLVANYRGTKVKPGSMGRQLPGVELELFGEDGKPASPGQVGQIALRLPNPQMMLGYRNDPDKSAAVLHRHGGATYFMTSDNARRDGDGYLYYEGRSDDVINSAGYRIGPQEVENALMEHPSVKEAAAVPSPDAERGEVVKAFIVLHAGYAGSDALVREMQDFVKRLTAPYKYPRRIEFVDELPKSPIGKIQRRELKARERARMENMA